MHFYQHACIFSQKYALNFRIHTYIKNAITSVFHVHFTWENRTSNEVCLIKILPALNFTFFPDFHSMWCTPDFGNVTACKSRYISKTLQKMAQLLTVLTSIFLLNRPTWTNPRIIIINLRLKKMYLQNKEVL